MVSHWTWIAAVLTPSRPLLVRLASNAAAKSCGRADRGVAGRHQEGEMLPRLGIGTAFRRRKDRESPQRVQWRARRDGVGGIPGIDGNVVSVSYGI